MAEVECLSCRRPKASLECELCDAPLCKSCARFLDAETFAFLPKKPDELGHTHYCPACFDDKVQPELDRYEETMALARESFIFFTTQKRPVPVLRKALEMVRVEGCPDRDETILRLAFLSALQGYNAVMETEVVSEKVRNAGYQKSVWRGKGLPVQVDVDRLERQTGKYGH